MVDSRFGRRLHDLEYFEARFFFIFLEFIINLRASIQKIVEKHQYSVILSCLKQILDNYVFNISTCTQFATSSKICRLFLNFCCQ